MNAMRRFLTGAAVAVGVLGIGASAFVACRQELTRDGGRGTQTKGSEV
ncbi:hypothetical protein [Treponema endosymbiont of Eucomonympha sp.]|nr:hypothetical protein [Treponema endosymbiont of Eucomonympha sp.]